MCVAWMVRRPWRVDRGGRRVDQVHARPDRIDVAQLDALEGRRLEKRLACGALLEGG